MAEEPKPKPGKIRSFFNWIGNLPSRFFALSLPTKACTLSAVALVIVVTVAWLVFLTNASSVPWRHAMTPGRILAVIGLLIVIPMVVYFGLKMWIEGETSRFADIDFAWKSGLDALAKNGLDIRSIPVFVILGSADEAREHALMAASGINMRVQSVPEGPAPLHWYANPEGIYLFCTGAGSLSTLATLRKKQSSQEMASQLASLEAPDDLPEHAPQPISASGEFSLPAQPAAPRIAPQVRQPANTGGDPNRGTMMLGNFDPLAMEQPAEPPAVYSPPPAARGAGSDNVRGTMMLQAPIDLNPRGNNPPAAIAPAAMARVDRMPSPVRRPALVPPHDSAEAISRLKHVCRLIKSARAPLCPVNGVVTLLSFDVLQGQPHWAEEMQRGVKFDLRCVQETLELRCPVTALVVGMEDEPGFRELVRRVGRQRAGVQRFGQRFDVRGVATSYELSALCSHVTGVFEDWVYMLFREKEAFTRPGNTRLYGLLCKVRFTLKHRLSEILAGGFGHDEAHDGGREPFLFSGCYFAAAGGSEDRQAFVKGVFDKLIEEQEEIEWTRDTLRSDHRYRTLGNIGLAVDAVLAVALVWMIVAHWWR